MVRLMDGVFSATIFAGTAPGITRAFAEEDLKAMNLVAAMRLMGFDRSRQSQGTQEAQGSDDSDQDLAKHGDSSLCFSVSFVAFELFKGLD